MEMGIGLKQQPAPRPDNPSRKIRSYKPVETSAYFFLCLCVVEVIQYGGLNASCP